MAKRCANFTGVDLLATNASFSVDDIDKLFKNCSLNSYQFRGPTGPDQVTERWLKFTFYFLASIGNFLLLFTMYKDPLQRFRNSTSYFIINLTIADLLSIVSGLCNSIFQIDQRKGGKITEEILACLDGIGVQCSFLITMIFAIDRYMAIAHPYKYQDIVIKKYFLIAFILIPWCFAIIALPLIYFAPAYKGGKTLTRLFAGDIIALICITLIVHPLTHWTFKKNIKKLANSSFTNKQIMGDNLKIAKVLATTVLVVSVCLITFMSPYLVAFIVNLVGCDKCYLSHAFLSFWMYYPLLMSVRLMINSVVYAWRLPLYRQSLKALVHLKCGNTRRRPPSSNRIANFSHQVDNICELNIFTTEAEQRKPNRAPQKRELFAEKVCNSKPTPSPRKLSMTPVEAKINEGYDHQQ